MFCTLNVNQASSYRKLSLSCLWLKENGTKNVSKRDIARMLLTSALALCEELEASLLVVRANTNADDV